MNSTDEQVKEESTANEEVVNETNPNVSTTTEVVTDSTTDKTDIESEDILKKNKETKEDSAKKQYILDKKDSVDWSSIEYEKDDPEVPLLTDKEIGIFSAISNGFIDDETITVWIDIARDQIKAYKDFEESTKNTELDDDDKSYKKSLEDAKQESITLLAVIQSESRKLASDFEKDKIAENTIKAVSLNCLRDFAVSKFRYSSVAKNEVLSTAQLATRDRTKEIESSLLKNMYVLPIFTEYANRFRLTEDRRLECNKFGKKYFNHVMDDIIQAVRIYIKNGDKKENIQISDIFDKDFEYMNYINSPIIYAYSKYDTAEEGHKTLDLTKINKDKLESFEKVINLNGYFINDSTKDNNVFKTIYDKCEEFINYFISGNITDNTVNELPETLMSLAMLNVKNDRLYDKYNEKGLKLENFTEYMTELVKDIPTIEDTHIGEWAEYYTYISKLNRYQDLVKVYVQLRDPEKSKNTEETHRMVFNLLISLLAFDYKRQYCGFVSDIVDFLKDDVNDGQSKEFMFKSIMNSMILQHSLGFRSEFDPATQNSGDGLYDLAKSVMGKSYDYIIVDKKDDILLKNVELTTVKENYYKLIVKLIDEYLEDMKLWNSPDHTFIDNLAVLTENAIINKKNKKK